MWMGGGLGGKKHCYIFLVLVGPWVGQWVAQLNIPCHCLRVCLPAWLPASALVTSSLKSHQPSPSLWALECKRELQCFFKAQIVEPWVKRLSGVMLVDFSHCSGWCEEPGGLRGHRGVEAALWSLNIQFLSQFMKNCHSGRASFSCNNVCTGDLESWLLGEYLGNFMIGPTQLQLDRKEKLFNFIEHIVVEPLWLVDQFSCNKV